MQFMVSCFKNHHTMKHLRFILAVLPLLLLTSCITIGGEDDDDPVNWNTNPGMSYEPVIMEREAFEAAVQIKPVQAVAKSGKIYINGNLLFINDVNKGFHIYNYSNPSSPVPVGFIQIPGATDLAMRNNVLFINQATDLVTMTYNIGANTITVTKRNRDVFPQKVAPNNFITEVAENEIIIDWNQL